MIDSSGGCVEISYVYALSDPRDLYEIKYIGQSINPTNRLRSHINNAKSGKSMGCYKWIRELLVEGIEPIISILEKVPYNKHDEAEKRWIALAKLAGFSLANSTEGGNSKIRGIKHTPETLRKISESSKGRKHTEESKIKIGNATRGHVVIEEARHVMSKNRKGKGTTSKSLETRQKMSKARIKFGDRQHANHREANHRCREKKRREQNG